MFCADAISHPLGGLQHRTPPDSLMRVRWTTDAADDLERICDYTAESRPESARRVAQSIIERIGTLETLPHLGRPGRVPGTREVAFPPLRLWPCMTCLTLGTK